MSHLNAKDRLNEITSAIRQYGIDHGDEFVNRPVIVAAQWRRDYPAFVNKSTSWLFEELQLRTAEYLALLPSNPAVK
jgi:hypothetical protein